MFFCFCSSVFSKAVALTLAKKRRKECTLQKHKTMFKKHNLDPWLADRKHQLNIFGSEVQINFVNHSFGRLI